MHPTALLALAAGLVLTTTAAAAARSPFAHSMANPVALDSFFRPLPPSTTLHSVPRPRIPRDCACAPELRSLPLPDRTCRCWPAQSHPPSLAPRDEPPKFDKGEQTRGSLLPRPHPRAWTSDTCVCPTGTHRLLASATNPCSCAATNSVLTPRNPAQTSNCPYGAAPTWSGSGMMWICPTEAEAKATADAAAHKADPEGHPLTCPYDVAPTWNGSGMMWVCPTESEAKPIADAMAAKAAVEGGN